MKTEGSAALVTRPNRRIGTAFSRALIAAAAATAADVTIVINNAGVRAGPVGQFLRRRAPGNGRGRSPAPRCPAPWSSSVDRVSVQQGRGTGRVRYNGGRSSEHAPTSASSYGVLDRGAT